MNRIILRTIGDIDYFNELEQQIINENIQEFVSNNCQNIELIYLIIGAKTHQKFIATEDCSIISMFIDKGVQDGEMITDLTAVSLDKRESTVLNYMLKKIELYDKMVYRVGIDYILVRLESFLTLKALEEAGLELVLSDIEDDIKKEGLELVLNEVENNMKYEI